MPSNERFSIHLRPREGPTLVLQAEETWIGRGTFPLSKEGLLICSKKQACLKNSAKVLFECHGLNPICFTVCRSVNFEAKGGATLDELFRLKRGEVLDLSDGDQFFLARKECLLTVEIKKKHDDKVLHFKHPNAGLAKRVNASASRTIASQSRSKRARANHTEKLKPSLDNVLRTISWKDVTVGNRNATPSLLNCVRCQADGVGDYKSGRLGGMPSSGFTDEQALTENLLIGKSFEPAITIRGDDKVRPAVREAAAPKFSDGKGSAAILRNQGAGTVTAFAAGGKGSCSRTSEIQDLLQGADIPDSQPDADILQSQLDAENLHSQRGADILHSQRDADILHSQPDADIPDSQPDAEDLISYRGLSFGTRGAGNRVGIEQHHQIVVGESSAGGSRSGNSRQCVDEGRSNLLSHLPEVVGQDDSMGILDEPLKSSHRLPRHENNTTLSAEASALRLTPNFKGAPRDADAVQMQCRFSPGQRLRREDEQYGTEVARGVQEIRGLQHIRAPARQPVPIDITDSDDDSMRILVPSERFHPAQRSRGRDACVLVMGMEDVIATVSGYEGLDRSRLIRLINYTGAKYVGSLEKRNTHLVCLKYQGRKFELARKLGTILVNHQWFEDSLKAGKRLSEKPYYLSGEVVGPVLWNESNVQSSVKKKTSGRVGSPSAPEDDGLLALPSCRGTNGASLSFEAGSSRTSGRIVESEYLSRRNSDELDRGKRPANMDQRISDRWRGDCGASANLASAAQKKCKTTLRTMNEDEPGDDSDDLWNTLFDNFENVCLQAGGSSCRKAPEMPSFDRSEGRREFVTRAPVFDLPSEAQRNFISQATVWRGDALQPSTAGDADSPRQTMVDNFRTKEKSSRELTDDDSMPIIPRKSKRQNTVPVTSCGETSRRLRRLVRTQETTSRAYESLDVDERLNPRAHHAEHEAENTSIPCVPKMNDPDNDEEGNLPIDEVMNAVCDEKGKAIADSQSDEVTCAICTTDAIQINEGSLGCGHKFCFPCIHRWADLAVTEEKKLPTCPLCKAPFDFISYREGHGEGQIDHEGYVIVPVDVQARDVNDAPPPRTNVLRNECICVKCGCRDATELLLKCDKCGQRACHTFCLDPPQSVGSSWLCPRCIVTHSRRLTREAYARLFRTIPENMPGRPRQAVNSGVSDMARNSMQSSNDKASSPSQPMRSLSRRLRQQSLLNFLPKQSAA